jgi:hypothetical protein
MNSDKNGKSSIVATLHQSPRLKIFLIMIISNLVFYILFFPSKTKEPGPSFVPDKNLIPITIRGELRTPFVRGLAVWLTQLNSKASVPAVLWEAHGTSSSEWVILLEEHVVTKVISQESWEIIPRIKQLPFPHQSKRMSHEISY